MATVETSERSPVGPPVPLGYRSPGRSARFFGSPVVGLVIVWSMLAIVVAATVLAVVVVL